MTIPIDFKNLKFIFIDFDGTLIDSIPFLFDNYFQFLKKYERTGSLKEFQTLMGPSIKEFIHLLKEQHELLAEPEELIHVYTDGLKERYKQESQLMEGSQQFLKYAHAKGLTLTLVTSSDYSLIEGSLEKLKLKKYFKFVVTGDKVQKTKPDPEIYLLALKTSSAKPLQTLSIEDSYNGIISSLSAKIPTIGIENEHLLNPPKQTILVKNWHDLLKKFKRADEK